MQLDRSHVDSLCGYAELLYAEKGESEKALLMLDRALQVVKYPPPHMTCMYPPPALLMLDRALQVVKTQIVCGNVTQIVCGNVTQGHQDVGPSVAVGVWCVVM